MSATSAQLQSPSATSARIQRGDRVLHSIHGLGQVTDCSTDSLTVQFIVGLKTVQQGSVRHVVPVTRLARMMADMSQVTVWTVRKANDKGCIQPDVIGRFAGHRVHYYDVARIPALIRELSQPDQLGVGTLVSHIRHGSGVISGYGPQPHVGPNAPRTLRLVHFQGLPSEVSVGTEELRRLIPSHVVAKRVGASRKSFRNLAGHRGIFPDYIAPHGRGREFYNEDRLPTICSNWNRVEGAPAFCPGRLVLGPERRPVRIVRRDSHGHMLIKSVQSPALSEWSDASAVGDLVSLRELARRQGFSRYKLSRLLTAVGIEPVYQHGKTLYFDRVRAEQALRMRLSEERDAVALSALANRTGVSVPVLAKKVRAGCIRTLGHHSVHYVSAGEAQRVEQVVGSLQSSTSVERFGICHLHPRGRAGHEVAAWDVYALVQALRSMSVERQRITIGQVAWLAEGAGRTRLRDALDGYLESIQTRSDEREIREAGRCLLSLIEALPTEFSAYAPRLALLRSGDIEQYLSLQHRIRNIADRAGCDSTRSLKRFCSRVHSQLDAILRLNSAPSGTVSDERSSAGSVLVAVRDGKPETGWVVSVERECWNPLTRCWHKTLMVRFDDGDRRIRLDGAVQPGQESAAVLLSSSEVSKLMSLLSARDTNTSVLKLAS